VIVVAELETRLVAGFAGFVEQFSGALVAVGGSALRVINPGADDVLVADDVCGFYGLRNAMLYDVIGDVDGRGRQAVGIEDRTQILRGVKIWVAGEFDFLIANLGDLGDGAGNIGAHHSADGVKLHADGIDLMRGGKTAEGE